MSNISIPPMPSLIHQAAEAIHRFGYFYEGHELRGKTADQIFQALMKSDIQLNIDTSMPNTYVNYQSSLVRGGFLIDDPDVAMSLRQYADQESSDSSLPAEASSGAEAGVSSVSSESYGS